MESIFQFDYELIKTKKNDEFVKTLLITYADDSAEKLNVYTSFGKYEGTVAGLISTPDFRNNLILKDVVFAGRVGYDSRFSILLEYLNVDGVPQVASLIYTKVY